MAKFLDRNLKFFRKTDLLIIAIILFVSFAGFFTYRYFLGNTTPQAQIFYKNSLLKTIELTKGEDYTFTVPEKPEVVFHVYSDGSIAFEHSDCPDKICVRSGRLHIVGESSACLPNELVLKLVSKRDSDSRIDMIVR